MSGSASCAIDNSANVKDCSYWKDDDSKLDIIFVIKKYLQTLQKQKPPHESIIREQATKIEATMYQKSNEYIVRLLKEEDNMKFCVTKNKTYIYKVRLLSMQTGGIPTAITNIVFLKAMLASNEFTLVFAGCEGKNIQLLLIPKPSCPPSPAAQGGAKPRKPYEQRTVKELTALAKSRGIKLTSNMRKQDIISKLRYI